MKAQIYRSRMQVNTNRQTDGTAKICAYPCLKRKYQTKGKETAVKKHLNSMKQIHFISITYLPRKVP